MNSEVCRSERDKEKSPLFVVLADVGRRQEMETWSEKTKGQRSRWAVVCIPESLWFPKVMAGNQGWRVHVLRERTHHRMALLGRQGDFTAGVDLDSEGL